MEKSLLIGNGINIQFGGLDNYSNSAIMARAVNNIKAGKYNFLTEDSLSEEEQLEMLKGLVNIIDSIKAGKLAKYADGLFMLMELERIKRTYPAKSTVESVYLEDYFLGFEIFNNMYKEQDGDDLNEQHRQIMFDFLQKVIVDSIYNDGKINDVYKAMYPGMKNFLNGFNHIFTTNYDYNIENILDNEKSVCHMHGEFDKLSPKYDVNSLYYKTHKAECDALISKKVEGMDHIYSDTIMSWSWLDKYGELIEPATKKENLFKSITGKVVIIGLAPNNDEHLFILLNQNPNIKSVEYYYLNFEDVNEVPHHINKPVDYKSVKELWESMK